MLAEHGSPNRARQRARELLIKALYQWQIAENNQAELLEQFAAMDEFEGADQDYFEELLGAVMGDVESLDEQIVQHADRDIRQLDAVSRAVLWLGLAELRHRDDVPTKVIINEAVELAKRFAPTDCFRFVNAVLDRSAKGIEARATA